MAKSKLKKPAPPAPAVTFDRIQHLRNSRVEQAIPPQIKGGAIGGFFKSAMFTVARDPDKGTVTAMLSGLGNAPPRDRDVRAFFRHWGITRFEEQHQETRGTPSVRAFIVVDQIMPSPSEEVTMPEG